MNISSFFCLTWDSAYDVTAQEYCKKKIQERKVVLCGLEKGCSKNKTLNITQQKSKRFQELFYISIQN